MVQRVIIQSEKEYMEGKWLVLKFLFLVMTFFIGIMIFLGQLDFPPFGYVSRIYGFLFLLPMLLWLFFKIRNLIN